MTKPMPVVLQLQADAVNPSIPVAATLRLAKVIATKLDQKDALKWIDRELNGYLGMQTEDLPSYRILRGQPKAYNPYRGWQAIHFQDADIADKCSIAPMGLPIGAIEEELRTEKSSTVQCMFPYPPETQATIRKAIRMQTDVTIFLAQNQIVGIVEAVRNLVLDWSLELEKAGILGHDMAFTVQEKQASTPVTNSFIIQNVGVLGNVSDNASVTNTQTAIARIELELLRDFLAQTKAALPLLPETAKAELRPVLAKLEHEAAQAEPDSGKIVGFLRSARSICEQAAGNLIAAGIIAQVTKLFSV